MDNRYRILILDDDENICSFLRIFFEEEGCEVMTSLSAEEGLKKALEQRPDIVFVDLSIPEMGGIEVLRKLKKNNSNMAVVMITGFGTIEGAMKAMECGAHDYLTKPIDMDFMKEVVSCALNSAQIKAAGIRY
ncbi:MAG: response regulator [Deltaproteobacteria bacterium]|nr:response regulator [Deltaproteobacteria bacterium]